VEQTPMHDRPNLDLLTLVPPGVERVVEAGCSSGALGQAFLEKNPEAEYIGIEMVAEYADVARTRLTEVMVANVEQLEDRTFEVLHPTDCWIFGDVLEHLYDPWKMLRRVRGSLGEGGCVVACIPNAQHWSVQGLLNLGDFRYQDAGLLDRTHIRWFTRKTIIELFHENGFRIEEMGGRVFDEPARARALPAIRTLAQACGGDAEQAEQDAMPLQYLVRARRTPD
jgi:trans-aconitate methyltransferase